MGATNFSADAFGKTVEEAFSVAREQAFYEYGHQGYTGSIAEKGNFILFPLPKGATAERVERMISDAMWAENGAKQRQAIAWLNDKFGARDAERLMACYDDKWGPAVALELRGPERARAAEEHLATQQRQADGSYKLVVPRTTKKAYRFMGYASC